MSCRKVKGELLRALVLGALLSSIYAGVGAVSPVGEDMISGDYDLKEEHSLFNLGPDQKVAASGDVFVVSKGTDIENKAYIFDGSAGDEGTLDLDMNGHSLSIDSGAHIFYISKNNTGLNIHNADTIKASSNYKPIVYSGVGNGNSISLQANKDIVLTQSAHEKSVPYISIKGNNQMNLSAGHDIILTNNVSGNLLDFRNGAKFQMDAGHDIVFNKNNSEPYIPNLYVSNANAVINAGNDIIYNRIINATPIGVDNGGKASITAKGNIIFHEERASNPVAINLDHSSDFKIEAQSIQGNLQRMTMVDGRSHFALKANDLQFMSQGLPVEAIAPKYDPMFTSMISSTPGSTVEIEVGNSVKLSTEITGTLLYARVGSIDMNAGSSIYLHNAGHNAEDWFQSNVRTRSGTINLTTDGTITIDNKGSIAALAEYAGEINFNGTTIIPQTGIGAWSDDESNINFNGETFISGAEIGAQAKTGSEINFNGKTAMSGAGIGAWAETDQDLWAESTSKISFNDTVDMDQVKIGASAQYNSDIVFNKGIRIDAEDNAFYTESAGRIQALATGEDKIIKGNMQALNGQIDVLFDTSNSSFTGATELQEIEKMYSYDDEDEYDDDIIYDDDDVIYDDDDDWGDWEEPEEPEEPVIDETPHINIALKNGAVWNVTGDSSLTNLENDAFVNLSDANRTGTSLTAQTLSGTGTMVMDLDWNSNGGAKEKTNNSDYLTVTDSATGTQALVSDKASMHLDAMGVNDRLYFATLANSDAVFTSPITQRNVQKGHLYDYIIGVDSETTATTDATDAAETVADRAAADTTTDWFFGTVGYTESPLVETGRINSQILYDLVTDVDTLNKRMGDVRQMNTDPDGWWARTTYTHQDRDSYSGHSNRFELGKDFVMTRDDGSTVHQGAVFTYLRSSDSFADGNGKYKRYSGSLYHTWLGNNGQYVDVVGRMGKVMGNSHTFLINGTQSDSSFGTWYQQASVETGKTYDLEDGWYFEPQAQLQYTHMNSKSYTSSDGINHDLDSVNSFIGRLGFRLGQKMNDKASWYVKGDILHEFSGDGGIMLTSANGLERIDYNRDGKDTWYDLGAGLAAELSPSSSVWFEFERKFSGSYSNDWEFNGGISWKF